MRVYKRLETRELLTGYRLAVAIPSQSFIRFSKKKVFVFFARCCRRGRQSGVIAKEVKPYMPDSDGPCMNRGPCKDQLVPVGRLAGGP